MKTILITNTMKTIEVPGFVVNKKLIKQSSLSNTDAFPGVELGACCADVSSPMRFLKAQWYTENAMLIYRLHCLLCHSFHSPGVFFQKQL